MRRRRERRRRERGQVCQHVCTLAGPVPQLLHPQPPQMGPPDAADTRVLLSAAEGSPGTPAVSCRRLVGVGEEGARRRASQSWRCAGGAGLPAAVVAGGAAPAPGVVGPGGHVAREKQPQQHRHACDAGRHVPVENELWVMAFARLELVRLGAAGAEAGLSWAQLQAARARTAGVALGDPHKETRGIIRKAEALPARARGRGRRGGWCCQRQWRNRPSR
jgi:hypothetical protein